MEENTSNKDNLSDDGRDEADCNVSVDSIVSINYDNLDSGNEAPEDFVYLREKIIKNYVTKTVILPGIGYDKPSKHDLVECN
jgi:hypothetical protein